MFKIMQNEELVHAQRLTKTCRAQLESTFPFSKAGGQGVPSPETAKRMLAGFPTNDRHSSNPEPSETTYFNPAFIAATFASDDQS
jgi:hypothetical protein